MNRFLETIIALTLGLIVLTFVSVSPVAAAAPGCPVFPTQTQNVMSVSCGISTDPCVNKCCVTSTSSNTNPISIPIVSDVLKLLGIGNPFDPLNQLTNEAQSMAQPCVNGYPSTPGDLANPACVCLTPTPNPLSSLYKACENIENASEKSKCTLCLQGSSDTSPGVWTSVGCIYADLGSFITKVVLGWGIGLAGGFSMLCIIYAAFMMQTSRGNAEVIKKAQQLLTSCIMGLMLIIFSVFILRLIGVSILKIPGFN